MEVENLDLYLEEIYAKHKPSKKLPEEFKQKLKESCLAMMAEVWRKSVEKDRERMVRNFEDFAHDRFI